MGKNLFLFTILLASLAMCSRNSTSASEKSNNEAITNDESTIDNEITTDTKSAIDNETNESEFIIDIDISSLELLGINKTKVFIKDTDNNKFIGYVDIGKMYPEVHIGDIFIYEKYIVLEEFSQYKGSWFMGGFCVYEYDEKLKIMEYKKLGNKLYDCLGDAYFFKGIHNDLLFIDSGTGPGIRGIEVFDLANNRNVLSGSYDTHFSFYNNIVYGLILTEWDMGNATYDGAIKKMFYEYKQETALPKETKGLFPEFILCYTYNIITKEIDDVSGTYILIE